MRVGRRSRVCTSHSCSSFRRTVSPAPPSNKILSGTTTAARPLILSSVLTCCTKLSCLLLVHDQKSPEVVADDLERFALLFALVVHGHHARLLAEGRIGQHQVEPVARIAAQAVIGLDRQLG